MTNDTGLGEQRHYVWAPKFEKELPGDGKAPLRCIYCARDILVSAESQNRLAAGGIGHECPNCKRYSGLVVTSCCKQPFLIGEEDWQTLCENRGIPCPHCNELVYFPSRPDVVLTASVRILPVLRAFTDSINEQQFVSAASSTIDSVSETALAVFHQTTYERIALSKKCIETLATTPLEPAGGFYNNNELTSFGEEHADETVVSNSIYQFAVSLFSAIESLAQELNIAFEQGIEENKVDYNKLQKKLLKRIEAPKEADDYIDGDIFEYLKRLRNLCQHRRIAAQGITIERSLAKHPPLIPKRLSRATRHLPDDPGSRWGQETFDLKFEVREKLTKVFDESIRFVDLCYGAAAKKLQEDESSMYSD